MRISGVTLGYRAVANGYPVAECVRCLLSFCDEVVANVGNSDDGTVEKLKALGDPRVTLVGDPWDLSLREKGLLLSRETNRAMERCRGDWVVYLQADEVLHEDDIAGLRKSLDENMSRPRVDGVSFRYLHFYGSPAYVQDNPLRWYTRAVRAVKTGRQIVSVGDALKFRRMEGGRARRVREVRSPFRVFHYGWARPPGVMLEKQKHLDRFWHDDRSLEERYAGMTAERIYSDTSHLVPFGGTHPVFMREAVAAANWRFEPRLDRRPRWLRLGTAFAVHPFVKLRGDAR